MEIHLSFFFVFKFLWIWSSKTIYWLFFLATICQLLCVWMRLTSQIWHTHIIKKKYESNESKSPTHDHTVKTVEKQNKLDTFARTITHTHIHAVYLIFICFFFLITNTWPNRIIRSEKKKLFSFSMIRNRRDRISLEFLDEIFEY